MANVMWNFNFSYRQRIILSILLSVFLLSGNVSVSVAQDNSKEAVIEVLDLKDMDVRDVMKFLSKESGQNIVNSPNVRGKISIYLTEISALDALDIIADMNAWVTVQEDSVIKVMTEQDYEIKHGFKYGAPRQKTRIISLQHNRPARIGDILENLKSEKGQIIADDKSRTLIITDYPKNLSKMFQVAKRVDVPTETRVYDIYHAEIQPLVNELLDLMTPNVGAIRVNIDAKKIIVTDIAAVFADVEQMIKAFDQRKKEVLIEAKIMQVTLDEETRFGVDWDKILDDEKNVRFSSSLDILGVNEKRGTLSFGRLGDTEYEGFVEALESLGDSRLLSSPRISVLDGQEAKILVGSQEPYVTTTTTTTSTGPATTAEDVKFIDVGVKLYVTPNIHKDGYVTMLIQPEVSSVVRTLVTNNNNIIPVVDTSQAETQVMVKDEQTVVIGGLIREEAIESTNQVPVIGDVPVLGNAFKNRRDFVRTNEIVIFLSPQIVGK